MLPLASTQADGAPVCVCCVAADCRMCLSTLTVLAAVMRLQSIWATAGWCSKLSSNSARRSFRALSSALCVPSHTITQLTVAGTVACQSAMWWIAVSQSDTVTGDGRARQQKQHEKLAERQ